MMKTTIKIFDDHIIFSDLLAESLNREERYDVSVARDYKQLLEEIKSISFDILILDLDIGGISGFEVIKTLKSLKYETKILMLSAETDKSAIKSVLSLGVCGFISKSTGIEIIKEGIDSVLKHTKYLCPKIREICDLSIDADIFIDITKLTNRERDILKLIGKGLSTEAISEKLNLSIHTINTHRKNIRLKFNLTSFNELIQMAVKYQKYL